MGGTQAYDNVFNDRIERTHTSQTSLDQSLKSHGGFILRCCECFTHRVGATVSRRHTIEAGGDGEEYNDTYICRRLKTFARVASFRNA